MARKYMSAKKLGILFIALVLASGCTAGNETDKEPSCDKDQSVQDCPPSSEDPPNPTAFDGALTLSGCYGYSARLDSSHDVFAAEYPAGISPSHSRLAFPILTLYACEQALLSDRVIPEFQVAFLVSLIDQPEFVPNEFSAWFLHEIYVTDQALVDNISNTFQLRPTAMDPVQVTAEDLPEFERISYEFPPGEPAYSVTAIKSSGSQTESRSDAYVFETDDGFGYVANNLTGALRNGDGVVEFSSSGYWGQHSDAPSWNALMIYRPDMTSTWEFHQA